ncbi:MAG: Gmad2 immunoglobulin-like domain-containing protein [Gemmatimonadota bacterium]
MRYRQKLIAVLSLSLVVALGCAGGNGAAETRDAADVADEPAQAGESEVDETAAVCLRGEPFVATGPFEVDGAGEGDADELRALRWQRHEGCERVVIDLVGEDGSNAYGPGQVMAEVLRDLGVVRVSLLDVRQVDANATEASFGGDLARTAYSVWSPDGRWTYVDVHLADAAEARVTTLPEPARVVVDLRPGGSAVPPPAPSGDRVVVLEPRPGPASYPLTVTGYARTFEANVVARIEQDGEEVFDDFTTATAWADAWGHYTFEIPDGPSGGVVLHVGEHSARDGAWQGVAVDLEMAP